LTYSFLTFIEANRQQWSIVMTRGNDHEHVS